MPHRQPRRRHHRLFDAIRAAHRARSRGYDWQGVAIRRQRGCELTFWSVATIELTPTSLVVHITSADQFFALASRLEVPLEHVAGVDPSVPEAHGVFHGLRMAGTSVPGLITAGRFLQHGEWAFWDVHHPDNAIGTLLHHAHYPNLTLTLAN